MRSDLLATLAQPNRCWRHRLTVVAMLFAVLLLLLAPEQGMATGGGTVGRVFGDGFELQREERLPAPDSVLPADALPRVGLRLLEGTVEPSEWRLTVDGRDVTTQAEVNATGIAYTLKQPLFEGEHVVRVQALAASWEWRFVTRSNPNITRFLPVGDESYGVMRPLIQAHYADVGSGVDPDSVRIWVDGADVSTLAVMDEQQLRYLPPEVLADGERFVEVSVSDRAGNTTSKTWSFNVAWRPRVEIESPEEELFPYGTTPEIRANFYLGSEDPESARVHLVLNDVDVTSEARISMQSLDSGIITYLPGTSFDPGIYDAVVEVRGPREQIAWDQRSFGIDTERVHVLEPHSPTQHAVLLEDEVEIVINAGSTSGPPMDLQIGGQSWSRRLENGGLHLYLRDLRLQPGRNDVEVTALFPDQFEKSITLGLEYIPPPAILIDAPADWSSLGPVESPRAGAIPGGSRDLTGAVQRPITITGNTSTPVVSVQINQQQAQLAADGRSFSFPNYFLHEGANHISAVATDAHGRSASDQITLYVDQTAPLLTVESPTRDAVTSLRRIDVRGLVNDAVQAPVETAAPRVRVRNVANGQEVEAVVDGLGYVAQDVPLEVGLNRLEVTARDQHGNERRQAVELVRTLAGSGRLVVLSGNRQAGPVDSLLPQPLVLQAFDAGGEPQAGVPVHLDIVRGSGSLQSQPTPGVVDGVNPSRNLVLTADGDGLIRAWLRVGVDARPGSDVVRAWSPGFAEEAVFSATAEAGAPHSVQVYGSAGMQYAATASTPIEALMVQVQDARHNPVPGTLVEFSITSGEARFTDRSAPAGVVGDDGRTLTVRADRNGIAVVRPQTGDAAGTVRVQAEALPEVGDRIGPVGFHLVVRERQDGPTRLAGTVLDHTGTALAGVRLSIARTALSVVSDADGYFEFAGQVPPGRVDLFVDGRDLRVNRSGSPHEYPALHFETSVVQGQLNQLPHPIYLPPIDLARAQTVGGDEEVTLTLPGFEGFEMRVKPNSVTFPDGSRVGPLVIAPVHNDRLPMVPLAAAGRFETVGWTIQPTNTRFDPPIEVRIPNTSGLRPGQTLPIQQWDHDLALFVPMGNGTVSEDGTQIVSDPGSGITKAGWGGGPPPPPPNRGRNKCSQKSVIECTECEELVEEGDSCPVCKPKKITDIAFTIATPPSAGSPRAEIETKPPEADTPVFDITVAGLSPRPGQDLNAKWQVELKRSVDILGKPLSCVSKSAETAFSGAEGSVAYSDLTMGSGNFPLSALSSGGRVDVVACGKKETKQIETRLLNPGADVIKTHMRTAFTDVYPGTTLRHSETMIHLACKETGPNYRHYNDQGLAIPNTNGDGGYGIMQLTFGKDEVKRRTCENYWDWRGNINEGYKIYSQKLDDARTHHTGETARQNRLQLTYLSACRTANPGPVVHPPALTGEQLLIESLRRYNGGSHHVWVPNSGPNPGCQAGSWVRHLGVSRPAEARYVEKACECDSPNEPTLLPSCPSERDNRIYNRNMPSGHRSELRFPETPIGATSTFEFTFEARAADINDGPVVIRSCAVVADGGGSQATENATQFALSASFSPVTLAPGASHVVRVQYQPTLAARHRTAKLVCVADDPARPKEDSFLLRVLPAEYASTPAPGAMIEVPHGGNVKLRIENQLVEPKLDSHAWALTPQFSGLSGVLSIDPPQTVPAPPADGISFREFEIRCANPGPDDITQTLSVSHNGASTGPASPATYPVVCKAAPP